MICLIYILYLFIKWFTNHLSHLSRQFKFKRLKSYSNGKVFPIFDQSFPDKERIIKQYNYQKWTTII